MTPVWGRDPPATETGRTCSVRSFDSVLVSLLGSWPPPGLGRDSNLEEAVGPWKRKASLASEPVGEPGGRDPTLGSRPPVREPLRVWFGLVWFGFFVFTSVCLFRLRCRAVGRRHRVPGRGGRAGDAGGVQPRRRPAVGVPAQDPGAGRRRRRGPTAHGPSEQQTWRRPTTTRVSSTF